jgi:hypothetical protein
VPPPFAALAAIAIGDTAGSRRDALYGLLRREQSIATEAASAPRSEVSRILDFAQAAYGDLVGVLVGRDDNLLDNGRDGEWSLRDVLRHAIAVEIRYAAQVRYSATRADTDPVEIPVDLLPCDRLSPPEPQFARALSGGIPELLELLGTARALSEAKLAGVSDSALARPSRWGNQLIDVRMRVHQIAVHLTETAIQVEKIVGASGELRAIVRRCCSTRGLHERWSPAKDRAPLDDSYRSLAT